MGCWGPPPPPQCAARAAAVRGQFASPACFCLPPANPSPPQSARARCVDAAAPDAHGLLAHRSLSTSPSAPARADPRSTDAQQGPSLACLLLLPIGCRLCRWRLGQPRGMDIVLDKRNNLLG